MWYSGLDEPIKLFLKTPGICGIIGKKYRYRGYGYEVCTAIKKYAKDILGAAKLNIIVSPDNIPSIKLAEKLGAYDTGRSANSKYIIMECELD